MGCASSFTADDAEHAKARDLLQGRTKGAFDKAFSSGRVLGKGGFSQVRAVRRVADGERLAVKVVTLGSGQRSSDENNFRTEKEMTMEEVVCELATWSAVQGSKHVVNLVSATVEWPLVFMVMERCETSILRKVSESPGFWARESQRVLKEMLLGVQACHDADIVHRDIKPQNYLLGADGSTVKLCDFGLAVRMPRRRQLQGVAGTLPFASPEMLKGSGYGKATDMWSFGVMAYYFSFGELPFNPGRLTCEGMKKAHQNGLPTRSRCCLEKGDGAADLVGQLLGAGAAALVGQDGRQSARCTVEEALAHWHLRDPSASAQASKKLIGGPPLASEEWLGSGTESTSTGCSTPTTPDVGPHEWAPPTARRAAPGAPAPVRGRPGTPDVGPLSI